MSVCVYIYKNFILTGYKITIAILYACLSPCYFHKNNEYNGAAFIYREWSFSIFKFNKGKTVKKKEKVEKESCLWGNSTTGAIQKPFNISYIWDRQCYVGIEAGGTDYKRSKQSHLKKIIHSNGC